MNNLIVCSIDRKFLDIARLFLTIVEKKFNDHPPIQILHSELTDADIQILESFPNVSCERYVREKFANLPLMNIHKPLVESETLYSRFCIFTDRYASYDNIIFMDVDMIVMGSLQSPCDSSEFFIVRDSYADYHEGEPSILENPNKFLKDLARDHIELPKCGANGGFFVVPKRYRTEENYEEIFSIISRYRDGLIWADQSALNLWILKNGLKVTGDYEYNFQFRQLGLCGLPRHVKIFHFNSLGNRSTYCLMKLYLLLLKVGVPENLFGTICFIAKLLVRLLTKFRAVAIPSRNRRSILKP